MAKLTLYVKSPRTDAPIVAALSDDLPIADVIQQLVLYFGLPPGAYCLQFVNDGLMIDLDSTRTLFEEGIVRGALLQLIPAPQSDAKAYRAAAKTALESLSRAISAKKVPLDRSYLAFDAQHRPGDTADLDALRQMVAELQARMDGSERTILKALEDLAKALADGGGNNRGKGGNGTGGGDGWEEGERPEEKRLRELVEAVRALKQLLESGREEEAIPKVHVDIPDLDIRVIQADKQEFIDANRKEARKWDWAASGYFALASGIAVNWVTAVNHDVSPLSWIVVVLCSVHGSLAFLSARRADRRAEECKEKASRKKKRPRPPRPKAPRPESM